MDPDVRIELLGGRDHAGGVAGKVVQIAQGRVGGNDSDAGERTAGQGEQAAGAAGVDHPDIQRSILGCDPAELGQSTVGHDHRP